MPPEPAREEEFIESWEKGARPVATAVQVLYKPTSTEKRQKARNRKRDVGAR